MSDSCLRSRGGGVERLLAAASLATVVSCFSSTADDWKPPGGASRADSLVAEAACAHSDPLRDAFFGDLHVHTAYSMDARSRDMLGTPDDAYRFARGEEILLGPFDANGQGTRRARLERPLDFAAVTDHAEWIGEVNLCASPGSTAYASEACRIYRGETPVGTFDLIAKLSGSRMSGVIGFAGRKQELCGADAGLCRASLLSAWQETQRATERWNDATATCSFTSFHGWEHSNSPSLSKVHRNVIFRNAAVPELPISSLEAPAAVQLWDGLDAVCADAGSGCEALTIPHNANVSNGRLFQISWADETAQEQRRQAELRARMDRVVEIMQVKGESECKNGMAGVVGAEDELCDFEKLRGLGEGRPDDCEEGTGSGAIRGYGCQSRVDFARYALIEGLREEERIGVNPFRFGLIGSTDGHNANPGDVEEYSYQGCCAGKDVTALTRLDPTPGFAGRSPAARNPGGLMGVWAEENSRDAIFDAMKRRETFATSGPRIRPRFFGGWDLPEDLCESPHAIERGYQAGVPMGAVLNPSPQRGRAPVFYASALRDPGIPQHPGGLLDRLQIIKVWHGEGGRFHQEVHDVAGRLASGSPSVAAAVDIATCEPQGQGSDSLCGVWSDPNFDSKRAAVYYARVVENPSCRWSWRECLTLPEADRPQTCSDPEIPRTIRERAWTSPIWYEPQT